ncbi:MAG: hypothetical protein AB7F32_08895 [Victivallaceae bacterium]
MLELRRKIANDLFGYLELSDALSAYGNVRNKIQRLLEDGSIIRIKKGFYTFPEALRRAPLEPGVVANLIHGPSYVSCEYALSFYGLIPEAVTSVTSVTSTRSCEFDTPVGRFRYFHRAAADYAVGVRLEGQMLIASPEKAIYDKAALDRRFDGNGVEEYLMADLRLDPAALPKPDPDTLRELGRCGRGRMKSLVTFLEKL